MEDGGGVLLEIGDSPFSDGGGGGGGGGGGKVVFFGFRLVDMMEVKVVMPCT